MDLHSDFRSHHDQTLISLLGLEAPIAAVFQDEAIASYEDALKA
jgi:hypothetical protein